MGYLFFYAERFLWVLWNLCEIYSLLAMIIFLTQRPQRAQSFISPCVSRLRWSGRKLRYDKSAQRVYPPPYVPNPRTLPQPSPRVAMEIAPLMEHRLTFSQSSKDSIRHKGGEYNLLFDVGISQL